MLCCNGEMTEQRQSCKLVNYRGISGLQHLLTILWIKEAYDSVRREIFYNILIEFGIPMKLVRLIKLCLTETYSRVRVGKHLSDMLTIRNGLKKGDALSSLLLNCALQYAIRRVQEN